MAKYPSPREKGKRKNNGLRPIVHGVQDLQGRLAVGAGPDEPDTGETVGLVVADPDGVADRDGTGEWLGRGVRDGLGDEVGDGAGPEADGAGLGRPAGVTAGWAAAAGTGAGRTRK
jgi:hypothetical protein